MLFLSLSVSLSLYGYGRFGFSFGSVRLGGWLVCMYIVGIQVQPVDVETGGTERGQNFRVRLAPIGIWIW